MSVKAINFKLIFNSNGEYIFKEIEKGFENVENATQKATKSFGDCFKSLLAFDLASEGIEQLASTINNLIQPGIELNTQMADLSAITGMVGEGLDKIESAARKSAKTFGTDATQNVEAYKLILSQLSPEIAQNDKALSAMGDSVNVLSKTMGGDTVSATNVLTTAMNQYSISLDDPIKASEIMGDMMNVMAAGAKEGSAELPQIAEALKQSGMMAKSANVSFEETNAAIQVLDKAGKKGAEGGVALRNVLTTLSQGRFLPKDVQEQLQSAGVDISRLTNLSIPLSERLRGLQPIMSDNALVVKLFGRENSAAAMAMLNGVDAIDEYKEKITGTNTAVEQAEIVMGSYAERMKRAKAWVTDLKISFFNLTQSFMPVIQGTLGMFTTLGQLAVSYNAITTTISAFNTHLSGGLKIWWKQITAIKMHTITTGIGAFANKVYAKSVKGIRTAMYQATIATRGFSMAIMSIPLVGWIIAAITAVVVGLKMLWDNSKRFREILFGIWEAGKAVFHNIGVVVARMYRMFIKPVFSSIWKTVKQHFTLIKNLAKSVWNGIGKGLNWLWNTIIKPVTTFFKDAFIWVFTVITETASNVWNWLTNTFSQFFGFINQTIITPIREAFSSLWTWIVELLDKIFSKFNKILAPIKKLWNAIFSSEGMTDVEIAYKEGEKKGAKSYDDDQEEESNVKKEKLTINEHNLTKISEYKKEFQFKKSIFDAESNNIVPPTKTIGGVAAKQTEKSSKSSGKNVASLNITKLVENFNIYNQNGSTMNKTQILQMVKEALLTASADFVAVR